MTNITKNSEQELWISFLCLMWLIFTLLDMLINKITDTGVMIIRTTDIIIVPYFFKINNRITVTVTEDDYRKCI